MTDTMRKRQRLARILRRAAADVEAGITPSPASVDDGGVAALNTVDMVELLDVIGKFGKIVDQYTLIVHDPVVVEPPPVDPPPGNLTPSGPIALRNGNDNTIRNKAIDGGTGAGVAGALDVSGNCDVADCTVNGGEYGAIISHGSTLRWVRTPIRGKGSGDNNYGIRAWMDAGEKKIEIIGDPNNRTPIDNRPGFKKNLRLSGYNSLLIQHMKLIGSGWWLGNGPKDNSGRPVCDNGHIVDCDIYFVTNDEVKAAVEMFEFVKNHTFERVTFWHLVGVSGHFCIEAWSDKLDAAGNPTCFGHKVIGCKVGVCDSNLNQVTAPRPFAWSDMRGGQAKHGATFTIVG